MVAALVQTLGHYLVTKRWHKMHLYVLGFALVFGGLTLWLHDDRFIKLKVTIFFWLVGSVILYRQFISGMLTIKELFGALSDEQWSVPVSIWSRINLVWGLSALLVGAANLYVAFVLTGNNNDLWVNFKVWGISIAQLLLMAYTIYCLYPYLPKTPEDGEKQ